MRKNILLALSALLCMPVLASAADAPSVDTVRQVMAYYHTGSDAVLVESKLCRDIAHEGANKNECVGEITDGKIARGEKAYIWMNFFVPGDDAGKRNFLVQFSRKGQVMKSNQLSMNQAIRYRTWYLLRTGTEGSWDISVSQERANDFLKLGDMSYSVVEAAPAAQ
jgi:hypothetical protein